MEVNQLDLMIKMAKDDVPCLLRIMKKNIEKQGLVFDENSRHIMKNVDLVKCLEQDETLYEELFDLLLEKVQYTKPEDTKTIAKLYRESTKTFYLRQKTMNTQEVEQHKTEGKAREPELQHRITINDSANNKISNLFSSSTGIIDDGMSVKTIVENLSTSPKVKSLYMFIEGLARMAYLYKVNIPEDLVPRLDQIRISRGWSRITPDFIANWHKPLAFGKTAGLVGLCEDIFSNEESVRRVAKESIHPYLFFFTQKIYKFHLKHPRMKNCGRKGKCGFMLKVTPMTEDNPDTFNIELCSDPGEYPPELHIHTDLILASRMHLGLQLSFMDKNNNHSIRNLVSAVSWGDKPVPTTDAKYGECVGWGKWRFYKTFIGDMKPVIYYSF